MTFLCRQTDDYLLAGYGTIWPRDNCDNSSPDFKRVAEQKAISFVRSAREQDGRMDPLSIVHSKILAVNAIWNLAVVATTTEHAPCLRFIRLDPEVVYPRAIEVVFRLICR